jgi:anti-sigma factor RsiW
MNEASEMTRDEKLLHAYHDGELSGFARRRFEQRLRRSPELQAELDSLSSLGASLRDLDAHGASPDLWDDIALRLPGLDAQREAASEPIRESWLAWLFGPAGAVLATAAAAVALALAVYTPEIQPSGATIRWLDTGGRSVMVFDDEADMTIIWMLDSGEGGVS